MNPFQHRKGLISFGAFLVFLLFFITLAHSLIIPPDPFESTDRFALLNSAPDGTITQVSVKAKAPGLVPLGPGELWALLQYKLPGNNKFFSSASNAISIQGLSPATSTLIELVFSNEPMPANAYHRTLLIYYQETSDTLPMRVAEYRPEQLLLTPPGKCISTSIPASGRRLDLWPRHLPQGERDT